VKTADVVILGSGSLATGLVYALSQVFTGSLQMAIIGRSTVKVSRMALIANGRAASFGARPFFFPFGIPEFTALAFPSVSFSQAQGHRSRSFLAVAVGEFPSAECLD
jgi:hypothetical protein